EPKQPDGLALQDTTRLRGDGTEDVYRRRLSARDEHRHPPQRSLLLDEDRKRVARLGIALPLRRLVDRPAQAGRITTGFATCPTAGGRGRPTAGKRGARRGCRA